MEADGLNRILKRERKAEIKMRKLGGGGWKREGFGKRGGCSETKTEKH